MRKLAQALITDYWSFPSATGAMVRSFYLDAHQTLTSRKRPPSRKREASKSLLKRSASLSGKKWQKQNKGERIRYGACPHRCQD